MTDVEVEFCKGTLLDCGLGSTLLILRELMQSAFLCVAKLSKYLFCSNFLDKISARPICKPFLTGQVVKPCMALIGVLNLRFGAINQNITPSVWLEILKYQNWYKVGILSHKFF